MNIIITEQLRGEHGFTLAATCDKVQGVVSIHRHGVQVLCVNAAHRVWRGGGRCFNSITDALAAYKSPEMRAIIQAAVTLESETTATAS
jgi:DNA-binding protein H-NS